KRRVPWGEQTDDEMMLGYIEYYLPGVPPGTPVDLRASSGRRPGGRVFEALDRNRDGRITPDESPSPAQFKAADADGNGEVTPEEFRALVRNRDRRSSGAVSAPSPVRP
ncbi:MAG: hypothetical protein RIT19_2111, partial [Verrucomicrobiota bacterium]